MLSCCPKLAIYNVEERAGTLTVIVSQVGALDRAGTLTIIATLRSLTESLLLTPFPPCSSAPAVVLPPRPLLPSRP